MEAITVDDANYDANYQLFFSLKRNKTTVDTAAENITFIWWLKQQM